MPEWFGWVMGTSPFVLPLFAWVRSVEQRLATHEAIIKKLDKLLDIMLEDRLGSNSVQDRRDSSDRVDSRRD